MGPKQLIQAKGIRPAGPGGGRPYSPALRVGDFLIISGQVPIDADGKTVGAGDPERQWRQVLDNIKGLLEAAGGTMDDIVFLGYYVTDMRHYLNHGEIRREYFNPPYPCGTAIGVTGLAQEDWCIEIEATAYLGK
jgi:2-iminobutanoate/2-iminopropanoate deaminase